MAVKQMICMWSWTSKHQLLISLKYCYEYNKKIGKKDEGWYKLSKFSPIKKEVNISKFINQ